MNIVIYSSTFAPNIGGLEKIMEGLATEWQKKHAVTVITKVADSLANSFSFKIYRQINWNAHWRLVQQADVYVEANISLKTILIGLFHKKKWFVIHHLPYSHENTLQGKIKNYCTNFCNNISVSKYVAATLKSSSIIIPNFYNPVFKLYDGIPRNRQFVFVGRLVSDKGLLLLIEAIRVLVKNGNTIVVDIIGNGPEKDIAVQKMREYQIQNNVQFVGVLQGEMLAKKLNEYKYIIIPSIWEEPFGIVALEGLACGCTPIYANAGGLPEAIGKFGISFERGNTNSLVEAMSSTFSTVVKINQHQLQHHLAFFFRECIAQRYLQAFNKNLISS